jgi:uncharacterized membrane protein
MKGCSLLKKLFCNVIKPETVFLWLAIVQCLAYWVTMQPFTSYYHQPERFLHVAYLAHVVNGGPEGTIPFSYVDYAIKHNPQRIRKAYKALWPQWQEKSAVQHKACLGGLVEFKTDQNPAAYSPIAYFPQLVGFFLGNIGGLTPAATLLLSQLINVTLVLGVAYYAIRLWPCFKWQLAAFLCLPTIAMQRMYMMPDALTVSLCCLFTGYVLSLRENKTAFTALILLNLALLAVLIGQHKNIYVPLLLLAALIPGESFSKKWYKLLTVCVVLFAGILSSWLWSSYLFEHYSNTRHDTWDLVTYKERLDWLFKNPLNYAAHLVHFLTTPRIYFLWIENQLFWYSHELTHWILAGYFLLMLSFIAEPSPAFSSANRIAMLILFIAMLAMLVTVMKLIAPLMAFLGFQSIRVFMQGRYLLPFMPLLWLVFGGLLPQSHRFVWAIRLGAIGFSCILTALSLRLI